MTDDRRLTTADFVGQHDTDADRALARDEDAAEPLAALLPRDRTEDYGSRWHELQALFVDDPRETVARADALVAELMQELASVFNDTRAELEEQWSRGDDVSTEDLRVALKRYRSFFERLLAA
jgi:uncharacterized protein (DUF2267 family)